MVDYSAKSPYNSTKMVLYTLLSFCSQRYITKGDIRHMAEKGKASESGFEMDKPLFAPATTKRASEVIYDQIYQKIVSGELQPGDRLPSERALAEQFQRSRPSVREALRMLQQNGLIHIETGCNGGSIVQSISPKGIIDSLQEYVTSGAVSVRDLVDYRRINEMGCARLAALNHTEEDAARLREIMAEYRAAVDVSHSQLHTADIEFHHILARASHNAMVIMVNDVVTDMMTKMFWGMTREMAPEVVEDIDRRAYQSHQALTDAVLTRDTETSEKCMSLLIDLFLESMERVI